MHKLDPIERLPDGTVLQSAAATSWMATACCWTASVRNTSLEAYFAGGFAAPCCPSSPSWNRPSSARKTPPLRSLRHGHPRPLRQGKILPRLRQGGSSPAEGEIRPQTALGRRQFGGEKPLNYKPSRTAKAARQCDFPRSREIEFYLST